MILTRDGDPLEPLVSLDQVKAHLRVDGDEEDGYVGGLIAAAVSYLDGPRGVLGRCVQSQRWRLDMRDGWGGELKLPLPHASDISAVLVDDDGQDQPLPVTVRDCDPWSIVRPDSGTSRPVRLSFTAGVPEDIAPSLQQAVLLIVGNWYLNREEVVTGTIATALPLSAQRILAPLKISWIA